VTMGLVNPNWMSEFATCLICFLEWVRALRLLGRSLPTGTIIVVRSKVIGSSIAVNEAPYIHHF
jgi:hypothetical protein